MNAYTCHHDPERHLAIRAEQKAKYSRIEAVTKPELAAVEAVIRAFGEESERAADAFSEFADPREAELASLKKEAEELHLAGKPVPAKSIQRRAQITLELARAKQTLESTCESNRRATIPLEKQASDLRLEIGKIQAIQNELVKLAHPDIRRERMLIELQNRAIDQVSAEIQRLKSVAEHNIHIVEELNREPGKAVIYHEQVNDYNWMAGHNATLKTQLLKRDRELHQQALAE